MVSINNEIISPVLYFREISKLRSELEIEQKFLEMLTHVDQSMELMLNFWEK